MARPPRGTPGGRPRPQSTGALAGAVSLARALSKFGVCSRREAERWIEAGRVQVGDRVERWPARRIDPRRDRVTVDGRRVGDDTERVVLALNKPAGYLTTRDDPRGRPTVYDLLGDYAGWVFPVGRLDLDTTGLLVLTNDHRLGQRLTDPEHHVPKTYHALVAGVPDEATLAALRGGLTLPDGAVTRPAEVSALGSARDERGTWLEIVLREGKNRQVRRMCSQVGHDVVALTRVAVGALALGDLGPGEWRQLRPAEVAVLAPGRDRDTISDSERS
jgi:23S rRNA pseudouridine2605 synthase